MKIYNQEKTKELNINELDFSLGHLENDKLFIAHHEAVEAQEAVYKERIVPEKSGFNSIYKELVTPAVEAKDAWDEYEDIQVFVPYTAEELKKIADDKHYVELKAELAKIKEDIEQETFGIVREDFAEKKARAAQIINELRVLEGKEPRKVQS